MVPSRPGRRVLRHLNSDKEPPNGTLEVITSIVMLILVIMAFSR